MIINLFTSGDSENIETWSNVPYFVAKKLENKGIKINRINIAPSQYINVLYKLMWGYWINKLFKLYNVKRNHSFQKSILNYLFTKLKILYYTKKYKSADLNFFMTYQFSSYRIDNRPYILFHDQTYEESIIESGSIICNNSKFSIKKEIENIKNANFVYTTTVHSYNFIKKKIDNVFLFKGAMKLDEEIIDEQRILEVKKKSNIILFIAGSWDGRGGDILVKIHERLNEKSDYKFKLIIVGDNNLNHDNVKSKNIYVYNYLSKNNKKELKIYKNLLYESKFFVMPMRRGPLPGVFLEANYYYTPVITTNIWNADQLIKDGINGYLIERLDVNLFIEKINELMNNQEKYISLSKKSHDFVKNNFGWDLFVDHLIKKLEFNNKKISE